MHIPAGGEGVADSVNLRISMNFGSMATNPFLIALDNVKRVAAHTDGLGQFVLLKGYAGEGHDSNHPQYDNIGVRMGGAEDMVTLMREGGELASTPTPPSSMPRPLRKRTRCSDIPAAA